MAVVSKVRVGFSLSLFHSSLKGGIRGTNPLRFTPGSPCASACTKPHGSSSLTSGINSRDIFCLNDNFSNKTLGKASQSCLNCLQNSSWKSGAESDQNWLLYNLRFAFRYCVYESPNASVGSGSCATPLTCGHLKSTMEMGIYNSSVKQYAYCAVDGAAIMGDAYDTCLECVQADPDTSYLSNLLVALRAGCNHNPPYSLSMGINGTVLGNSTAGVKPLDLSIEDMDLRPPNGVMVGILIGSFVITALLCFCISRLHRCLKPRIDQCNQRVWRSCLWFWRCVHITASDAENLAKLQRQDGDRRVIDTNTALGSHPIVGGPARLQQVNVTTYLNSPPQVPEPAMTEPIVIELMERMERFTFDSSSSSTMVPSLENSPRESFSQGRSSLPRNEIEASDDEEENSPWGVNQAISPYGRNRTGAPVEPLRAGASNFQAPPEW